MKKAMCFMLILFAFIASCRKISDSQPPFTSVSYPLAVGNWWEYQLTAAFSNPDTFTLLVDSMVADGPYTKYICNYVGNGAIIPAGYFLLSDTSMSFIQPYSYWTSFPSFHLKFPVETGQHWPGAYPPQDSILVSAVNDSCGGYGHEYGPCYYLEESYNLPHNFRVSHMILTPKVGLIQQAINFNSDTAGIQIQQSITLLNYHVQ
jgi:hypothetical protein